MASAPMRDESVVDRFLEANGHDTTSWDQSYNKKQCPECGGLHEVSASDCSVCGWTP